MLKMMTLILKSPLTAKIHFNINLSILIFIFLKSFDIRLPKFREIISKSNVYKKISKSVIGKVEKKKLIVIRSVKIL